MTTPETPELDDLAEQIGSFMEYWGFKKVHGMIWLHLYLCKEHLDAAALMQRLDISKALVSVTLKELLEFQVILEGPKSNRGTRTYRAVADISAPIMRTIRSRERRIISQIERAYNLLGSLEAPKKKELQLDQSRLNNLGAMIKVARGGIDAYINRSWLGLTKFLLKMNN